MRSLWSWLTLYVHNSFFNQFIKQEAKMHALSDTQEPQSSHKNICWKNRSIYICCMNKQGRLVSLAAVWLSEGRTGRSEHLCLCFQKSGKAKVLIKEGMVSQGSRGMHTGKWKRKFNVICSLQRPVRTHFRNETFVLKRPTWVFMAIFKDPH